MNKPREIANPSAREKHITRFWIHIGMHKTATDAIQTSLSGVKNPKGWCDLKVVSSEEGLLEISRSSCAEHLEKFTEIHDIKVPDDILPASDPIHPVAVADMIERSRDLIRAESPDPLSRSTTNLP